MSIKYIITVFSLSVLVGCGGGGSTSIDSIVNEVEDQNDAADNLPTTFDSLEKLLPWGLNDETGATTALTMALYSRISYQFLTRAPILPVPHEPNDDECDFGGNVTSSFKFDSSIEDYFTYSISRDADMCRTSEKRYFDGHAEVEGITDSRGADLIKVSTQYSSNNFSTSSFIGSIANGYPLKNQLSAVKVYVTGGLNQSVESDSSQNRQDDTDHYIEESNGLTYSVDGFENTFKLISHNRDGVRKELNINDLDSDKVTVTTVSMADYSSSWVMKNNAEGNALMRAAGFFAGSSSGMGYKNTFPEGAYSLSVKVLTPIVRSSEDTVFPSKGSLLVDLSSHNISAIVTFSGGAQVSITTNGVNVVTNLDKSGQVIQ